MVLRGIHFLIALVFFACSGSEFIHAAERGIPVAQVKIDPLQLGMLEKRALQLIKGRNFQETAPGDFLRDDGNGAFTRLQYEAVDGKIALMRLYQENMLDRFSQLAGYLDRITKDLGDPDEKNAGQDMRDPRIENIYYDQGEVAARLTVSVARGEKRHAALFTLTGPMAGKETTRAVPVAAYDLQGLKLGMTEDELVAAALAAGYQPTGARNYSKDLPVQGNVRILWNMTDGKVSSISQSYRRLPVSEELHSAVKAAIDDVRTRLGDPTEGDLSNPFAAHATYYDDTAPNAPRLEVRVIKGQASFMLTGDPNFQPPAKTALAAIALNPEILAEAESMMAQQAALPEPIALKDARVRGVGLGMTQDEATAATVASGLEQQNETTFAAYTDDGGPLLRIKYEDGLVSEVTLQAVSQSMSFDIAAEKAAALEAYGRPSQATSEDANNFYGLYREDTETTRTELQVTVSAREKYIRLYRKSR